MPHIPKHIKNYCKAFGYNSESFIPCENCGAEATDVHHIEPRSSFGSKRKDEKDSIGNLIALCRGCHNLAHGVDSRLWKSIFTKLTKARNGPQTERL